MPACPLRSWLLSPSPSVRGPSGQCPWLVGLAAPLHASAALGRGAITVPRHAARVTDTPRAARPARSVPARLLVQIVQHVVQHQVVTVLVLGLKQRVACQSKQNKQIPTMNIQEDDPRNTSAYNLTMHITDEPRSKPNYRAQHRAARQRASRRRGGATDHV